MTTKTATEQRSFADLFPSIPPERVANLPVEIKQEIAALAQVQPARPRILAIVSAMDVEAAHDLAQKLQDASIKMTFPEDWVVFRTKDGADLAYLQDVGCQRVRPLWAISFESIDMQKDVIEEIVPSDEDEDVAFSVVVQGECALTGESQSEVGFRASTGFFERAWRASKNKPVERAKVRADIRKSAIVNGRGRLVRTFTGLGQVPVERLVRAGLLRQKLRGADFQSGTRGGSGTGSGASEPQLQAIVKGCYDFGKVSMLGAVIGRDALEALVRGAALSGGREGTASKMIEELGKAKKAELTIAWLEERLGAKIGTPEPGAEG